MLQLPCRLPVTSTLRVKIRLCQKCLLRRASRRGQFDLPEGFRLEPLFFDTTTASGHFLIAIGKRNVVQCQRSEQGHLMKCPALPRNTKTGQPALLRATPCPWLSRRHVNRHRSPTSQKSRRTGPCVWASPLDRNPRPPLPPDVVARRLHGARSGIGTAI